MATKTPERMLMYLMAPYSGVWRVAGIKARSICGYAIHVVRGEQRRGVRNLCGPRKAVNRLPEDAGTERR